MFVRILFSLALLTTVWFGWWIPMMIIALWGGLFFPYFFEGLIATLVVDMTFSTGTLLLPFDNFLLSVIMGLILVVRVYVMSYVRESF